MRELPASITNALYQSVSTFCQCWKLTAINGKSLGFTDHDRDIELDGFIFLAETGFSATDREEGNGLSASNFETTSTISSLSLCEKDIRAGLWDGALAEIWLVNWQDISMRMLLSKSKMGDITREGSVFRAQLLGKAHALTQSRGRILQSSCDAVLGDKRCGINLHNERYSISASISGYSENGRIILTQRLDDFAAEFFTSGIVALSGGERFEIKTHQKQNMSERIEFWRAPQQEINIGDTIKLYAGCDRSFATCCSKFSNMKNFRGFPHIPGRDYLSGYPVR